MSEQISFPQDLEWPDLESMNRQELEQTLAEVQERIALLDEQEPADMVGEAYEVWGARHEELEDLEDEIRDLLDEL